MAGLRNTEVRDLPLHPEIGEASFEEAFDLDGELRDGKNMRAHISTKYQLPNPTYGGNAKRQMINVPAVDLLI
jgi:hypothetical protein